jgi:hypothetical protein
MTQRHTPLYPHKTRFLESFFGRSGNEIVGPNHAFSKRLLSLISPPSTPLLVQNAEASFKVLGAVPDIMNKVQLFQDRILTDAERLPLATGAATYRLEDPSKAPIKASMLLNTRRYGDDAKDLWTTLNTVQENIIRGGQRDYSRRRQHGRRTP